MKLSVLICTASERVRTFLPQCIEELDRQCKDYPDVEFYYLGDNCKLRVGAKRHILLQIAQGEYVVFVDDDDIIVPDYISSIYEALNGSDVIVFDVAVSVNGSPYKPVKYDIAFKNDKDLPNRYERLPNHLMVVKRELALKASYPNMQNRKDAVYAKNLQPLLKTQNRINKTLYYYIFNSSTTIAQRPQKK